MTNSTGNIIKNAASSSSNTLEHKQRRGLIKAMLVTLIFSIVAVILFIFPVTAYASGYSHRVVTGTPWAFNGETAYVPFVFSTHTQNTDNRTNYAGIRLWSYCQGHSTYHWFNFTPSYSVSANNLLHPVRLQPGRYAVRSVVVNNAGWWSSQNYRHTVFVGRPYGAASSNTIYVPGYGRVSFNPRNGSSQWYWSRSWNRWIIVASTRRV